MSIYNSSGIRTGNTGNWKLVSCRQDMSGLISITSAIVIGAALLSLAATGPVPAHFNLHERMTVEEIREVFQTDPHTIPEYEVTEIQWPKLHKRAAKLGTSEETATHIRLNAFGRNVSLWLRPIDGILAAVDTPVYHARADVNGTDGVRFDKIVDPMRAVGRILEDKDKKATLVVKQAGDGKKRIFGNIGSEKWTIRPVRPLPLPLNFSIPRIVVNYYDHTDNFTEYKPQCHVIYKTSVAQEGTKYVRLPIESNSSRPKRATNVPSIIYPQILVIVDYASYLRHNKDTNALLEYLLLFWNSVDLRYRSLQYPKIRLNIAGVIIEAEPDTLPYIRRNKVTSEKLNVYPTLIESSVFRRKIDSTFPSDNFDITVTMTACDLCNGTIPGCLTGTKGLAFLEGACRNVNAPHPKSISIAIIEDLGGFGGVHYAAHELGHLFGAGHDTTPEGSCSGEMGYIMSPHPVLLETSVDWSPCTLTQFDKFFKKPDASCLFNKPSLGSPMPRVLPGRLHNFDDQCMKLVGTKTCVDNPYFAPSVIARFAREICLKLRCYDQTGLQCMVMNTGPADGSACGDGMICLHAKCIRDPELSYTNGTKLP